MKTYHKYLIGVAIATSVLFVVSWRRRAANAAVDYINVQEIGDNQGWSSKLFQQMIQSVGWKSGEAWCMYFAKAVFMSAYPAKADKINKVLTGSTQGSLQAAEDSSIFKVIREGSPRPGDIVIWQSVSNSSLGHAGIVRKRISGADMFDVVEGNTSLDGAREGQGVMNHDRKLLVGYVDGTLKVAGYIRMKLF
jgi:hypothetical protein